MSGLCRHNASYEQHKDASRHAEKVIRSQVSHLFWGNTQLLKMPQVSNKVTQLKRPIPNWIKKLGYLPNWLESLSVSLVTFS